MPAIAKSVDYDPEKFGAGNLPEVGKYHGIITKAEEPNQNGQCIVELQVLAGTTPKQEGKTIQDRYFPFNVNAAARLKHLFHITQVATLEQINSGEDIPMSSLLGKQVLFEISMSKERTDANGKVFPPRPQVGWRPEAVTCMVNGWDKVPRHEGALRGELDFQDAPIEDGSGFSSGASSASESAPQSSGSSLKTEDPFDMES